MLTSLHRDISWFRCTPQRAYAVALCGMRVLMRKSHYSILEMYLEEVNKTNRIMESIYPYLKIMALSDLNLPTQRPGPGYEREYYDIIWIREGSGSYIVNHSHYTITPNSLLCGTCGQYQQLVVEKPVTGIIISFNRDFIHQGYDSDGSLSADILSDFMNFSMARLKEDDADELNTLTERMQREWTNGQQMKMQILTGYLHILLIHVRRTRKVNVSETSRLNAMVRRFFVQIETDFTRRKSVRDYASLFCVTANYLNQLVKQQTGGTAGYYIRRRIIAEAKRKAMHSDQNMKQIAFSLGFVSEAHFSKYFKNYTGVNFSEFKRNCFQSSMPQIEELGFSGSPHA
jgi:AraC family transcriptional regulator, transcriptional activator of pobA